MASSYPGAIDSLTNPVSTDPLTSPAHATQHTNVNDAVEAIEATLGVNPQGAYPTVVARLAVVDVAAGSASASAAAAAVSASSAAGAAVDAGAAANSAVAVYDNFDDRYLGAKASAPSVDNDGNALLTGALYWNSTSSEMFVWTGSTWQTLSAATVPQSISVNSSAAALRITQTGTGNALLVEDSANPDSTPFVVDASGNVGIGGTPSNSLLVRKQVAATSTTPATADAHVVVTDPSGSAGTGGMIAVGSADKVFAAIKGRLTDGTSNSAGDLTVLTRNAAADSTLTERMRIDSAGNVGIGTSSSSHPLHVYRAATDATVYVQGRTTAISGTGKSHLQLDVDGNGGFSITNDSTSGTRRLDVFSNSGTPGTGTRAMSITSAGNVGIGTSSPDERLVVVGPVVAAGVTGANKTSAVSLDYSADGNGSGRILAWGNGATAAAIQFYNAPANSGATERMRIDNAGLITGTGTSLGAWTAYTPTLTGNTVGNGTLIAQYMVIGKLVMIRGEFTLGSTSAIAGDVRISVPPAYTFRNVSIGAVSVNGYGIDVSTGATHMLGGILYDADEISLRVMGTAAALSLVSATNPFTWATSDTIRWFAIYEAA